MEQNFNFKNQIATSIEQSKKLIDLGVNIYTADMNYHLLDDEWKLSIGLNIDSLKYIYPKYYIPAWSLGRLIELLPKEYRCDIDFQNCLETIYFGKQDNFEELIETIKVLIEDGYFYSEFLN